MRTVFRRRSTAHFNVTPLIDVVMLLIIFFLVSSHFVRSESLEEIELPEATHSEEQPKVPRRLVVTITAEGSMHVGGRTVNITEIERMLVAGSDETGDDLEVHIRADRSVPYRVVQPIIMSCVRTGITRFQFPVILQ